MDKNIYESIPNDKYILYKYYTDSKGAKYKLSNEHAIEYKDLKTRADSQTGQAVLMLVVIGITIAMFIILLFVEPSYIKYLVIGFCLYFTYWYYHGKVFNEKLAHDFNEFEKNLTND